VHGDPAGPTGLEQGVADPLVVGVGEGLVVGGPIVVERVGSAPGAVDELVEDDEVARVQLGLQRPGGARRHEAAHAELPHRPHVGPVGDGGGDELVLVPVSGEEGDPASGHGADGDRRGGSAVGRVHIDFRDVVEELVEPRSAEDPDLGGCRCGVGHVSGWPSV
jgi:hypothetical protein